MNATEALRTIESLITTGLKDQREGWRLACVLTENLPDDPRINDLRRSIVDLLVAIEIETVLGGAVAHNQQQLHALLDWVAKHQPKLA